MEKLCFGTLVQLLRKADHMLKKRETVEMLLDLVLDYSYPPIKGQRGDDFVVTDKIASNLVNRKVNLPQNIVQAAREDEGVISSAQEHVEKNIRRKLSPASLPIIIDSIIAVVRDDLSIPGEKQEEFISSANDAIADEEAFSRFFSEILLYSLRVNNNRLEYNEEETHKSSMSVDASDESRHDNEFDEIAFEKLDAKYKGHLWKLVAAKFAESNISLQVLCDAFYDKYHISIDIADLTRYFYEPNKRNIPLTLLWEACNLLGIPMSALFRSAEMAIISGGDSSQNIETISPPNMTILTARSDSLITNPHNRAFHAYLGTYYTYFTPTHSDNSKILKGKLTFFSEGATVRAHFELNTNQFDKDDNPIINTYDGMLVCSTSVDCCYCILSSAVIGEMSFVMFRHIKLNHQKLKCRMATVLTASAGSEDRNPTIHRMFLSREEIQDEDLAILLPFLFLTTSEITISQQTWEEFAHNSDIYSDIMSKFRVGHELKPISCYQLRENTIRSTFRDATLSHEASATPFISAIRSKAIAYRYNKVSKKVDKSLYDFLKERGYFKRKSKT